MSIREAKGSPKRQGRDEKVFYTFDFTPWGFTAPTVAVCTVYNTSTLPESDVTTTVMPTGSASIAGAVVTCPLLQNLTAGTLYRLECKVTQGVEVREAVCRIIAEA